jgi:hypothetical protein
MRIAIALISLSLSLAGNAHAHDIEGTALTSCPGYAKDDAGVSQLSWTVGCFLQAIKDRNKSIIAALSEDARCYEPEPCDGAMSENNSIMLFGSPSDPDAGAEIPRMLDQATFVNIFPRFEDDRYSVEVLFAPRPGPSKIDARIRYFKDRKWFICGFYFDAMRGIWVVWDKFCHFETEFVDPREDRNAPPFDLDGNGQSVPYMVWKPRKSN